MTTLLERLYPIKQELSGHYGKIHEQLDQGALNPGRANLAMADLLSRRMTGVPATTGVSCFSIWFREPAPNLTRLAGWSTREAGIEPLPELEEGNGSRHRVLTTRRPLLVRTRGETLSLAREILVGAVPASWTAALLAPLEKAGEALGLALAFCARPVGEADLEGLLRLADQLASALFTTADGLPPVPGNPPG